MIDGSAINETLKVALGIDTILREEPRVQSIYWVIGRSAPAFYYNIASNRDTAPGYAQAMITAQSPKAAKELIPNLRGQLQDTFPQGPDPGSAA